MAICAVSALSSLDIFDMYFIRKAHLVAYERHPAVVRPGEADDGRGPVVDELDAPPTLVLDPDEDDAGGVAGGQLLVGLVPPHEGHLQIEEEKARCRIAV